MRYDDHDDTILHANLTKAGPLLGEPGDWSDARAIARKRSTTWRIAAVGLGVAAMLTITVWIFLKLERTTTPDAKAVLAAVRIELSGGKTRRITFERVDLDGAELNGTLVVSRAAPVPRAYADLDLTLMPTPAGSPPLAYRAVSAQEGGLGWLFLKYAVGSTADGSFHFQWDYHASVACDWFNDATCLIANLPIRFAVNIQGTVADYVFDQTHRDHVVKTLRLIGTLIDGSHADDVLALLGEQAEDVSLDPNDAATLTLRTTLRLAPPKTPKSLSLTLRYDSQTREIVSMSATKPDPTASFGRHVRMIDALLGPMPRDALVRSFEDAGATVTVTQEDDRFSRIVAKDVVVDRWLTMPAITPSLFDTIEIALHVDRDTGAISEITLGDIGVAGGVARITFEPSFDESLLSSDRWLTPDTRIFP